MLTASFLIFAIIASYMVMLWRFAKGWKRLPSAVGSPRPVQVTVIVPARNEEANIRACLADLLRQDYPQAFFRVVMVDDGSEDGTAAIAEELAALHPNLTMVRATGAGKKQALRQAIDATGSELIATVDADCRISPTWLSAMVAAQQQNGAGMVLGPVVLTPAPTLFQRIQRMEFLAIMGITGGSAAMGHPVMANGANLLFERAAFMDAGGYSGSSNPSGDDVFLMLKMKGRETGEGGRGVRESANESQRDGSSPSASDGGGVGRGVIFVKDPSALVSTAPMPTFRDFWQQRKRWLSKKGGYTDMHVKATAIVTYLANVGALMALVLAPSVFPSTAADLLISALLLKTVADLLFIRRVARDLMPSCGIWEIVPAELFILIYTSLLGLVGNVREYRWKGRAVRIED
ncbi:MAG: glycosyltransferase [Flavobacteriales bacterium]|nr:glycosyltransferase [Flavobacteriales bacterium]